MRLWRRRRKERDFLKLQHEPAAQGREPQNKAGIRREFNTGQRSGRRRPYWPPSSSLLRADPNSFQPPESGFHLKKIIISYMGGPSSSQDIGLTSCPLSSSKPCRVCLSDERGSEVERRGGRRPLRPLPPTMLQSPVGRDANSIGLCFHFPCTKAPPSTIAPC